MSLQTGWVRFKFPSSMEYNILRVLVLKGPLRYNGLVGTTNYVNEFAEFLGKDPGFRLHNDKLPSMVAKGWLNCSDNVTYSLTEKGRKIYNLIDRIAQLL